MAGYEFSGPLADAQFATKLSLGKPEALGGPFADALPHQRKDYRWRQDYEGPGAGRALSDP